MATRTTWIESEETCYPSGAMIRRGRAILRENPHNPVSLPYGETRAVRAGIPDTYWTIPARVKVAGRRIPGYVSVDTDDGAYTFTPNADPARCAHCAVGTGCKKS